MTQPLSLRSHFATVKQGGLNTPETIVCNEKSNILLNHTFLGNMAF